MPYRFLVLNIPDNFNTVSPVLRPTKLELATSGHTVERCNAHPTKAVLLFVREDSDISLT